MELIEYNHPRIFLEDILSFVDENSISHYFLFKAIDRLILGEEKIYYGCTVKNDNVIEIIYMNTNINHYFFGNTKSKLAVHLLSESLSIEQFYYDTVLWGNTFIIDHFIKKKRLNFKNVKHRYYMSLKSCAINEENLEGKLHIAREEDYDSLIPLKLGFFKEEFEGNGIQSEESLLANFKKSLSSGSTYYWKVKNQITTLISLTKLQGENIYIPNIYTIPQFRNKKNSKSALGTLLIQLFDSGKNEVGLNVKTSNESAIGLFSSLGMKIIYETGIYESKNVISTNKN